MSTVVSTYSFSDSYHKLDNVLYEIKDGKGIPKNINYEPWKVKILNDLTISGFIVQKGDLHVLTEAGREVIKNVSFRVYNQKIKSGIKIEEEDIQKLTKKVVVKSWFLLLLFGPIFILMILKFYKF